jgi:microcystin-dependent protein
MDEPFIAEIQMFAGNFAPRGWAFCDGQLLPINQNQALFSLIGTTYGGDGRTTFGLPNLNNRAPVGPGQGPGLSPLQWGQALGAASVTLAVNQMPAHPHGIAAVSAPGTLASPEGASPAATAELAYTTGAANALAADGMVASMGGGQPFSHHQPALGVNFVIATVGIFPARN